MTDDSTQALMERILGSGCRLVLLVRGPAPLDRELVAKLREAKPALLEHMRQEVLDLRTAIDELMNPDIRGEAK